jgi:hypothetical protein
VHRQATDPQNLQSNGFAPSSENQPKYASKKIKPMALLK